MSDLLIDVGNTRLKWMCDSVAKQASHSPLSGAIVVSPVIREDIEKEFAHIVGELDEVLVSSVSSDELNQLLVNYFQEKHGVDVHFVVCQEHQCGLISEYLDLSQLGVDRWCAAIGARLLQKTGDVIVVDAGTAITIDWLSADDIFKGGVIIPGQKLMSQSLNQYTQAIQVGEISNQKLIGKSTQQCVSAGVYYASFASVSCVVDMMKQEIMAASGSKQAIHTVVTGGGADKVIYNRAFNYLYEPLLVLLGLKKIKASEAG